MNKMKIILALAGILLFFVIASGCMNLAMTEKYTVSQDAQVTHSEFDLTMDRSTYNLLKLGAEQKGYDSVQDFIQANLSKNLGPGNVTYTETWDTPNNKVTLSFSSTDAYSPPSDSKISIRKDGDNLVYQDDTFYSPQVLQSLGAGGPTESLATPVPTPAPTSALVWNATSQSYQLITITPTPVPTKWVWNTTLQKYMQVEITPQQVPMFNASQEKEMMEMMLSGVSVDYYLEMPGKIVNTTATVVDNNKAEWHFGGGDIMNTSIYAESQPPSLIPGFTSTLAVIGCALVIISYGYTRKKSR
jgi:hypothetical protein